MTPAAREVLRGALELPSTEREALIAVLCSSLEPHATSPEWQAELAERLRRIDAGEATFLDAEEHLQMLRAKHR